MYLCFPPVGPLIYSACTLAHGHLEVLSPCPLSNIQSCFNYFKTSDNVYVVTGASRGVGYYAALILLQRGFTVLILCRNPQDGEIAKAKLIQASGNSNCHLYVVDLNDGNTILKFLQDISSQKYTIRGLINNAGMIGPESMNTNHIGHFILTIGLLQYLKSSNTTHGQSYVVNVSSVAHIEGSFHLDHDLDILLKNNPSLLPSWQSYSASKAANALFGLSYERVLNHLSLWKKQSPNNPILQSLNNIHVHDYSHISMISYHPGVMMTDLWRNNRNNSNPSTNSTINTTNTTNTSSEGLGRQIIRNLCCCCIKHPMISAAGVTALVAPRTCFSWIFDNIYIPPICRTICIGSSSGNYFQQCGCCCVLPVRPSYVLYNPKLQDKLWTTTLEYISHNYSNVYEYLMTHEVLVDMYSKYTQQNKVKSSLNYNMLCYMYDTCHIDASYPCTECVTCMPYCVCVSCLC